MIGIVWLLIGLLLFLTLVLGLELRFDAWLEKKLIPKARREAGIQVKTILFMTSLE